MAKNPFLMAFLSAIQFFKSKKILPTNTWKDVSEQYQAIAFTIAGVTKASLLSDIKSIIEKQLQSGISPEQFRLNFREAMTRAGWNPEFSPYRVNLILSQNARSAYGFGRFEQMRSPQVMKTRKFWQWSHRDSVQFRPNHKAIDERVFPADHPFFQTAFPPCAFGCRCAVFALNERDLAREGLTVSEPPNPKTIADPGFKSFPKNLEEQRTQLLDDAKKRLPPNLARLVEEDAQFQEYLEDDQPRDAKGRWSKVGGKSTQKSAAPPYKSAITNGKKLIDAETQKSLDNFSKTKKQRDDLIVKLHKKGKSLSSDDIELFKSKMAEMEAAHDTATAALDKFRAHLIASSTISKDEAKNLAQQVKIHKSALKVGTKEEFQEHLQEFFLLTNGKGAKSIKELNFTSPRAAAFKAFKSVNVGEHGAKEKSILFHEFAHHTEFENKKIAESASDWIASRKTGELQTLKDLTKNEAYGEHEKAYPDMFVSPYVGKYYPTSSTEVVSVGVQHFATAEAMLHLYHKDKEHFHLTLGLMRD